MALLVVASLQLLAEVSMEALLAVMVIDIRYLLDFTPLLRLLPIQPLLFLITL